MQRQAPLGGRPTKAFNLDEPPPYDMYEMPEPAPPPRIRVNGKTPERRGPPPPTPKPQPAPPRVDASGLTPNMRLARNILFIVALALWLYTDGPQSYWGTGAWVDSIRRYLSGGAVVPVSTLNPYAVPVLYVILTAMLNSLWLVFFMFWDYATQSAGRTFKALVIALISLVPLTALDVAKGAAGFYEYFAVLDLSNYNDLLALASLGEAFLGSVVAQLIVMMAWSKRGIWAPAKQR